jgi:hypothetical protein
MITWSVAPSPVVLPSAAARLALGGLDVGAGQVVDRHRVGVAEGLKSTVSMPAVSIVIVLWVRAEIAEVTQAQRSGIRSAVVVGR